MNRFILSQHAELNHKYLIVKILLVIMLPLNCTSLFSQNLTTGWVYIENVQTGLVIDVQGNVKSKGTTVWPYTLNYSNAQMFRFTRTKIPNGYGSEARYIRTYNNSSSSPGLYFSVKIPALLVDPVKTPKTDQIKPVQSSGLLLADDGRSSSNRNILKNYVYIIEEKIEYKTPKFGSAISLGHEPKQIWKIIPVPNEPDVYFIQSAHFNGEYVIEPLDLNSGGKLVLGEFTGSNIQKWRILKTAPNKPEDVNITNFKWERSLNQSTWKFWEWHYEYKIKGT